MYKEIDNNKYPTFYEYIRMGKKEANPLINSDNKKTSPALDQCWLQDKNNNKTKYTVQVSTLSYQNISTQ